VHNRGTRAFIPAGLLKVCESHYLLPKQTASAQRRATVLQFFSVLELEL